MGRGSPRFVVLALVGVLVLSACASDEGEPSATGGTPEPAPATGATSETGAPSDLVEAEIPVACEPIGIATGEGSIWVVNSEFQAGGPGSVSRIDPATNEVVATIEVVRTTAPSAGSTLQRTRCGRSRSACSRGS